MTVPGLVSTPIPLFVPAGADDADIFCFFVGSGGDPIISIADGSTTTNYVRFGSMSSGMQIPAGGFARYVVHADPSSDKTVYVTVTYTGSTSFTNLYAGPGNGAFVSVMYNASGTLASVTVGDTSIF
jgi:hypothetical protein